MLFNKAEIRRIREKFSGKHRTFWATDAELSDRSFIITTGNIGDSPKENAENENLGLTRMQVTGNITKETMVMRPGEVLEYTVKTSYFRHGEKKKSPHQ
jgi:hypothetical protein